MECCSGAAPESRAATSRDDEAKLWGSATQPGAGCGVQCRAEGRALEPRDASRRFTHDGHNTPHQRPARWLPGLYVPWPRFESAAGRLSGALARSHGHVPPHTAPRRCLAAETASAARAAPSYPTPVAYRLPPALLTNCTPQPVPGCVAEPSAREEAVLPTTVGVSYIRSPPSKAQLSPRLSNHSIFTLVRVCGILQVILNCTRPWTQTGRRINLENCALSTRVKVRAYKDAAPDSAKIVPVALRATCAA